MFRLVSKRELALYAAQIEQYRQEIVALKAQIEHERKRAEGAINALLVRVAKIAITPEPSTMDQQEEIKSRQLDIFGDGQTMDEAKALEELQK